MSSFFPPSKAPAKPLSIHHMDTTPNEDTQMNDDHKPFPTHGELQAQIIELQSLNAELMEQVADLQASEAKTCRALEDMRQRDDNLNDALRDELALTAELQAEIGRLNVVEAQNADALMGMNDQVIDLHTKLTAANAQIDSLKAQVVKDAASLRELRESDVRVYRQARMMKQLARQLMDEVQL